MGFNADGFIGTWFGSAQNGSITISGDVSFQEDRIYDNLTISDGITVNTCGYRLYVKGTLTLNGSACISNSGTDAGWFPPLAGGGGICWRVGGGTNGASAPTMGQGLSANSSSTVCSIGGAGGAGGNTTYPYGGQGGTSIWNDSQAGVIYQPEIALTGGHIRVYTEAWGTAVCAMVQGGSGGGSGALLNYGSMVPFEFSGAGGGGGGIVYIAASKIVLNSTSKIRANGGKGGGGYIPSGTHEAGGGGGGGGGGVIIHCGTITLNNTSVLEALGGSAGTGANGGANGVAGSNGKILLFSESGVVSFSGSKSATYTL